MGNVCKLLPGSWTANPAQPEEVPQVPVLFLWFGWVLVARSMENLRFQRPEMYLGLSN